MMQVINVDGGSAQGYRTSSHAYADLICISTADYYSSYRYSSAVRTRLPHSPNIEVDNASVSSLLYYAARSLLLSSRSRR